VIKLLLADDSVTIQRVVELTFSGEDVQVISVGDGEQAIARMQTERPDIVLADIGMPKRDGYEVAAFMKGHKDLSNVPVLLLAGAFEPVDEARAREVKSDGVLVKPFEPQQVIARVRELVHGFTVAPAATPPAKPVERPVQKPTLVAAPPPPVATPRPVASPPRPVAAPFEPPPAIDGPALREGLDDYFSQLDAAFATFGAVSPGAAAEDPFADRDIPTVDDLLGDATLGLPEPSPMEFGRVTLPPVEPPDASPTRTPAPPAQAPRVFPAEVPAAARVPAPALAPAAAPVPAPAPAPIEGSSTAIADVFRVLFTAEQEGKQAVLRLDQRSPAAPVVTDDLVDEVTRRVLARLAPDTARQLVADIVSEIAERLVREEIERIRNSQ
jgi:CheY-like chemotaxis protein